MCNEWIYIRAEFEKQYASKKCPFECVANDVKKGNTKCICIPCVAVNYIANEMKFWQKKEDPTLAWELLWEETQKRYFVKKSLGDWNLEIYDMKLQGKTRIDDAELCEEMDTKYSYIKIRKREEIQKFYQDLFESNLETAVKKIFKKGYAKPRKILWSLLQVDGKGKAEIEIYTLIARDFRNRFSMEMYIDMLFRLLFFLHPFECLKVIERNMKEYESEDLRTYNKGLLDDYQALIKELAELDLSVDNSSNINKILKAVGKFVKAEVIRVYISLDQAQDDYGDIKNIHELFKNKANDALKLGARGGDSRINKIRRRFLGSH